MHDTMVTASRPVDESNRRKYLGTLAKMSQVLISEIENHSARERKCARIADDYQAYVAVPSFVTMRRPTAVNCAASLLLDRACTRT